MIKAIAILSFLAVVNGGVIAPAPIGYHGYAAAAPVAVAKAVVSAEPFDPNPQYNYGYSVQDGLTGDAKGHQESRNGDLVQGQYSLVEPDGAVRTVTYTASDATGFNAVVDRSAPTAVKVATPVAKVASPVYAGHGLAHGPIAYHH